MNHELQFNDGNADWCVHCGTFSCYLLPDSECTSAPTGRFDSREPVNYARMAASMFGQEILNDEGRAAIAA